MPCYSVWYSNPSKEKTVLSEKHSRFYTCLSSSQLKYVQIYIWKFWEAIESTKCSGIVLQWPTIVTFFPFRSDLIPQTVPPTLLYPILPLCVLYAHITLSLVSYPSNLLLLMESILEPLGWGANALFGIATISTGVKCCP